MTEKIERTHIWLYLSDIAEFRRIIMREHTTVHGHSAETFRKMVALYKLTHHNTLTQKSIKIGKIEDKRVISLITELWNFCDLHEKTTISARELKAKITKCAGKDPRTHRNYINALIDLRFIENHKELVAHFEIKKDYIQHKLKENEG